MPALENKSYEIQAVAKAQGTGVRRRLRRHREARPRDAATSIGPPDHGVRGIDVSVPAGLKVGYVMGVGDQVPVGLAQLGAKVTLLGEKELATANLGASTPS